MFWAKKIVRRVKLSGVDITFFANSVAHSTVYVPIGVVKKSIICHVGCLLGLTRLSFDEFPYMIDYFMFDILC